MAGFLRKKQKQQPTTTTAAAPPPQSSSSSSVPPLFARFASSAAGGEKVVSSPMLLNGNGRKESALPSPPPPPAKSTPSRGVEGRRSLDQYAPPRIQQPQQLPQAQARQQQLQTTHRMSMSIPDKPLPLPHTPSPSSEAPPPAPPPNPHTSSTRRMSNVPPQAQAATTPHQNQRAPRAPSIRDANKPLPAPSMYNSQQQQQQQRTSIDTTRPPSRTSDVQHGNFNPNRPPSRSATATNGGDAYGNGGASASFYNTSNNSFYFSAGAGGSGGDVLSGSGGYFPHPHPNSNYPVTANGRRPGSQQGHTSPASPPPAFYRSGNAIAQRPVSRYETDEEEEEVDEDGMVIGTKAKSKRRSVVDGNYNNTPWNASTSTTNGNGNGNGNTNGNTNVHLTRTPSSKPAPLPNGAAKPQVILAGSKTGSILVRKAQQQPPPPPHHQPSSSTAPTQSSFQSSSPAPTQSNYQPSSSNYQSSSSPAPPQPQPSSSNYQPSSSNYQPSSANYQPSSSSSNYQQPPAPPEIPTTIDPYRPPPSSAPAPAVVMIETAAQRAAKRMSVQGMGSSSSSQVREKGNGKEKENGNGNGRHYDIGEDGAMGTQGFADELSMPSTSSVNDISAREKLPDDGEHPPLPSKSIEQQATAKASHPNRLSVYEQQHVQESPSFSGTINTTPDAPLSSDISALGPQRHLVSDSGKPSSTSPQQDASRNFSLPGPSLPPSSNDFRQHQQQPQHPSTTLFPSGTMPSVAQSRQQLYLEEVEPGFPTPSPPPPAPLPFVDYAHTPSAPSAFNSHSHSITDPALVNRKSSVRKPLIFAAMATIENEKDVPTPVPTAAAMQPNWDAILSGVPPSQPQPQPQPQMQRAFHMPSKEYPSPPPEFPNGMERHSVSSSPPKRNAPVSVPSFQGSQTPRAISAKLQEVAPQNPPQSPPKTRKLSKPRIHPPSDASSIRPSSDASEHHHIHQNGGHRTLAKSLVATTPPPPPQAQLDPAPVVGHDDEIGIPLDEDPFAKVEGVKMLKPISQSSKEGLNNKRSRTKSNAGQSSISDGKSAIDSGASTSDLLGTTPEHEISASEAAATLRSATEGASPAPSAAGPLPGSAEDYRQPRTQRRAGKLERVLSAGFEDTTSREPFSLALFLADPQLLSTFLSFLSFYEWLVLSSVSKAIRIQFVQSAQLREEVLENYLRTVGYVRWGYDGPDPLSLSLQDLSDYMRGVSTPSHEYARVAGMYVHSLSIHPDHRDPSLYDTIRSLAASTRAYTRVVLRLRAQAEKESATIQQLQAQNGIPANGRSPSVARNGYSSPARNVPQSRTSSRAPSPQSSYSHGSPTVTGQLPVVPRPTFQSPLFRLRRAPLLRVFVPSPEGDWLSDKSVLECEAEIKRAGVSHLMRMGDVVWDVAVGDEGNVGRLVWDGSYLIDLDYTYSPIGDLPKYMPTLAFPPSYFHRVIRTGPVASNPIVHIDLSPWGEEIAANLQLLQDRVRTETPQGAVHNVVRWVHRSSFLIRPPPKVAPRYNTSQRIARPPTPRIPIPDSDNLYVDPGWYGTIVVETEGTNESLADLQDRCGPGAFPPRVRGANGHAMPGQAENRKVFRILRERSRPGEIWIRTVSIKERLL